MAVLRQWVGVFTVFWMLLSGHVSTISAQENTPSQPTPVKAELVSEDLSVQPGQPFWVTIKLTMEEGWHLYWKNPGDAGLPPEIQWKLPEGYQVDAIQWPFPKLLVDSNGTTYGYDGELLLLARVVPPANESSQELKLSGQVHWIACKDSCVPGDSQFALTVPVAKTQPQADRKYSALFTEARHQLPQANTEIKAVRTAQGIEFKLPLREEGYSLSYFFSEPITENPDLLYFADQKLEKTDHGYILTLEGKPEDFANLKQLRGVIVVAPEKDPSATTAWEIDTAIGTPTPVDEMNLAWALVLAMLGGLVLNLMPCVLPVIALKVMSFVKLAGQDRRATMKHGFAFFGGAMIAFWALASILLAFRAYGETVGWGFQLQSPLFVGILAYTLFLFSLSLFGVFELGTSVSGIAGRAQGPSSGLWGSFSGGLLATAVATPCTGPFLGTTVGFAVTLPAWGAIAIFTAMGFGMAAPYLLLSSFPALLRFLPKPGPWMVVFKELMGFIMLATVLWLIWVFSAHTDTDGLHLLLSGFLVAGMGCWIYGKWGSAINRMPVRVIAMLIALVMVTGGGWNIVKAVQEEEQAYQTPSGAISSEEDSEWIPFSAKKLAELREKNVPVFIDFTAKWCLICQANKIILNGEEVERKFAEQGVVKMRADWTKNDPEITQELQKFGRSGVPLYLMYGPNKKEAEVLPQVLTSDLVIASVVEVCPAENIADSKAEIKAELKAKSN
jgi:thiol:disulfide interchange protein